MILLAFDFGTKNIGIAIGEYLTKTSRTLTCIPANKNTYWIEIQKLILEWKPIKIIIGLPLNIRGKKQKTTIKVKKFAVQLLKKFNIPIYLHDERFTTKEAKSILFNKYGQKKFNSHTINSTSALIILRSWLYENMHINLKKNVKNNKKY
ncbi:Holliday junction resolvase RuvX [Buchnera aphidicola]|uniref:Holliday junction resolvase RuvX n=1 Tax=Buchnera aphidicola TaxID=9 RepID=UPI003464E3CA